MPLLNFQKRFVPKVESGEKRHTIRARRKNPIKIGDTLYLYWGLRSKHARKLRQEICTNVIPIEVHVHGVKVGGDWITDEKELDAFAQSDGFESHIDFFDFWKDVHGLNFNNPLTNFDLIQWVPT